MTRRPKTPQAPGATPVSWPSWIVAPPTSAIVPMTSAKVITNPTMIVSMM